MSKLIKLAPRLKELRIHLCQTGQASRGVREFVEDHYVGLKSGNPRFPILVRECSGVQPKLWARYDHGKEVSVPLSNLSSEDVLTHIKTLANK